MASKFRIFHTTITLSPDKVEYIVLSSVVAHNLLRKKLGKNYLSTTLIDQEDFASGTVIPGAWRNTPTPSDAFQSLKQDRMFTEGPH